MGKASRLEKDVFKVYCSLTDEGEAEEGSSIDGETQNRSSSSFSIRRLLFGQQKKELSSQPSAASMAAAEQSRLLAERRAIYTAQCWWPYFGAGIFSVTYMRKSGYMWSFGGVASSV